MDRPPPSSRAYRKLERDECEDLHGRLKDFVQTTFRVGSNRNADIVPFMDSPMKQSHMTVRLTGMVNIEATDISNALAGWKEGTTFYMEPLAGGKTIRCFIDVPILVKRGNGGGDAPAEEYHYRSRVARGPIKPSAERAMFYVMMLVCCVVVVAYKAAVGQAPGFVSLHW